MEKLLEIRMIDWGAVRDTALGVAIGLYAVTVTMMVWFAFIRVLKKGRTK